MEILNLGNISYQQAYQQQLEIRQAVYQGAQERIILCSHPSIVTFGRQSQKSDLTGWQGDTYKIERGGRATYHGPQQAILYPIIDLSKRANDIHRYVRQLEEATVNLLTEISITDAIGNPDKSPKTTGVWVGSKKIASIGIAVKHWITYHGIALNVNHDPLAFSGINPCGFSTSTMTSIEALRGEKQSLETIQLNFANHLKTLIELS